MINFCGLGTSTFKATSFHDGESSQAPFGTPCPNGSRHVRENLDQLTHDQAKEQTTMDPKQYRRISNRHSARRSRERRLKYTIDLEEKVQRLQENITALKMKKDVMTQNKKHLLLEKRMLEQQMYNMTLRAKIQKMQIENSRAEISSIIALQLGRRANVDELDLTLSLAQPGIQAK